MARTLEWLLILVFFFGIQSACAQARLLPNGGVFTPRDTINALFVFVAFEGTTEKNGKRIHYGELEYPGWDQKENKGLPNYVDSSTSALSFVEPYGSKKQHRLESNYNLTDYFNEVSLGKFHFFGTTFGDQKTGVPELIEISPVGAKRVEDLCERAIRKMQKLQPDFDWSLYDRRKNQPGYLDARVDLSPDGKPDYIVFIFRYNQGMKNAIFKRYVPGWGGSTASSYLSRVKDTLWKDVSFDNSGFSTSSFTGESSEKFFGTFLHELGHRWYNAPHYNAANGAPGQYFFIPASAYGMMSSGANMNLVPNGWERWALGWISLDPEHPEQAYSISEIPTETWSKELRDYVTTGDAIRLLIPGRNKDALWIEYHTNVSEWERGSFTGSSPNKEGYTIGKPDSGIYVFTEHLSSDLRDIPKYGGIYETNGLMMISAQGKWDVQPQGEISRNWSDMWNNPMLTFKRKRRNILSGHNSFLQVIGDYPNGMQAGNPKDGSIKRKNSVHGGSLEALPMYREWIYGRSILTYPSFGLVPEDIRSARRSPMFQIGDTLSFCGDAYPESLPRITTSRTSRDKIDLHGMNIWFTRCSDSSIFVHVDYSAAQIHNSVRWTGNMLWRYDTKFYQDTLVLDPDCALLIDRSGYPNTFEKQSDGSFVLPSTLELDSGTVLHLRERSLLKLSDDTKLIVRSGAKIIMEKDAGISIDEKASVVIEDPTSALLISQRAYVRGDMDPTIIKQFEKLIRSPKRSELRRWKSLTKAL